MNAQLCKQLRGLARARSVGMPERAYFPQFFTRREQGIGSGGLVKTVEYRVYTTRLTPQCTRGVYRVLKKAYRRLGT